jgi:hypothetical protein
VCCQAVAVDRPAAGTEPRTPGPLPQLSSRGRHGPSEHSGCLVAPSGARGSAAARGLSPDIPGSPAVAGPARVRRRVQARPGPPVSAAGAAGATGAGAPSLGRRPAILHRRSRQARHLAQPRHRAVPAGLGRPPHVGAPGPDPASVGELAGRRPGGWPLGHGQQDPPRHDRRRLWSRHPGCASGPGHPPRSATGCFVATTPRALAAWPRPPWATCSAAPWRPGRCSSAP